MSDVGASLLGEKFDPYGEVLPGGTDDGVGSSGATSARLARAGQIAFWVIVAVVVFARMTYFPAGSYF
jgi:hypothetical protein